MKIDNKEMMLLALFGVGLLAVKNNDRDINNDGTADNTDRGLILFVGALAAMYLL